jgi:hypothetical protein
MKNEAIHLVLRRSRPITQSAQTISPLRQRMIDDIRLRQLSPKAQTGCIRAVKRYAGFLGRSLDSAKVEDLRRDDGQAKFQTGI